MSLHSPLLRAHKLKHDSLHVVGNCCNSSHWIDVPCASFQKSCSKSVVNPVLGAEIAFKWVIDLVPEHRVK